MPFSVTDEELAKIFSEKVPVVSAHVVKKRNGKSKGFGFVEYASEEHQQEALKEFPEGKTLQDRPINVKVAMVPELNAAAAASGDAAAAGGEKKEGAASDADAKKGESAAPASTPAAATPEKKDEPEKKDAPKDEKAQ